eukprot:959385_1
MFKHQRVSLLLATATGLMATTVVSGKPQGLRGSINSDIVIANYSSGSRGNAVAGVRFIVAALDERERTSTKCMDEVDAFLEFLDSVSDTSLGDTNDLTFYEGECDHDAMEKHVENSSNAPLSSGNHSRDVRVVLFNVDRREALSCSNALRTIYGEMDHWNIEDLPGVSAIDVDFGECESEIKELSSLMREELR